MRKIVLLGFISIIYMVLMSGCNKTESVKIGAMLDLTGRSSALGIDSRNAIQMAVDAYNLTENSKSKRIQLVIKDDGGKAESVEVLLKSFEAEGVSIIIGPLTSNIAAAIVKTDYFLKGKMLFISPTVTASVFSGLDDALLTMIDVNEKQGALLARKAIADGIFEMAIVYEETNNIYTEPVTTSFQEEFEKLGGKVVYTNQFATSKDAPFGKLAQEIVDSEAKGVLLAAGGMDASQLSQHLFKLGSHQQIFTGMWSRTEDFIKNGSKAVEGAYSISTYDIKDLSTSGNAFVNDYLEQYKYEPVFTAFHSYDVTQLLIQNIVGKLELPLDPQSVKETIINLDYFDGILGEVSFDKNGDCNRPYLVVQVMKGVYEKVIQP